MKKRHIVSRGRASVCFILSQLLMSQNLRANGVGENVAWQFNTSIDKVNRGYLEDMRQKKANDYYAAPNITNIIDKQFNCSVSASASGNLGTSTVATSGPATTGNGAVAKANEAVSQVQDGSGSTIDTFGLIGNTGSDGVAWSASNLANRLASSGSNGIVADLSNTGQVGATAQGDTSSVVGNTENYQALNSAQTNSGTQTASVDGANGCNFASMN